MFVYFSYFFSTFLFFSYFCFPICLFFLAFFYFPAPGLWLSRPTQPEEQEGGLYDLYRLANDPEAPNLAT